MDLDRFIKAIQYIDENLEQNLKLSDIAKVAGYSQYHFDRLFRYAIGESLIEYVRKRKLTEAALELLTTEKRIIDIAIKYGFQSQQSFTATFRKYFDKTPRQYRIEGHRLVLLEKSRLSALDIERLYILTQNKVRHVCKEAFTVMGYSYFGANQNNEIPLLFNRFLTDLHAMDPLDHPKVYLGLCDHVPDYDSEKSEFDYMVCIEIKEPPSLMPEGMMIKTIPTQEYVVFTHVGNADTLESTYQYIYGTYFFKSDLELINAPDFEYYDHRFDSNSEASEIDIYIPVKGRD